MDSIDAVPHGVQFGVEFAQPLRLISSFGGIDGTREGTCVRGKQVQKYPGLCDVGIIGHSLFLSRTPTRRRPNSARSTGFRRSVSESKRTTFVSENLLCRCAIRRRTANGGAGIAPA
ncbi:hypothetical protein, partial [Nocardia sp. NPDC057030]|uniref:hypothetical protein n=1 Tax=Nocardia sp. NPDC057030 TaxID=3346005 RepID=UPI0036403D47